MLANITCIRMKWHNMNKRKVYLFLYLQCGVINKQQYARWREQGLAFEMREGVYQTTNPSLLSTRVFSQVSVCFSAQSFYTMQQ